MKDWHVDVFGWMHGWDNAWLTVNNELITMDDVPTSPLELYLHVYVNNKIIKPPNLNCFLNYEVCTKCERVENACKPPSNCHTTAAIKSLEPKTQNKCHVRPLSCQMR